MPRKDQVLLVCSECYPVAKVGGMADVVGALPKYLLKSEIDATVIIPRYELPWFQTHAGNIIHEGIIQYHHAHHPFRIVSYDSAILDFPLIAVDLPGLFDRDSVYLAADGHGFRDEAIRNISFQRAVLQWWKQDPDRFDLIHCHDHMTGLIPFFMNYSYEYSRIREKPSFFTIHNALHRGRISWSKISLLPHFDTWKSGLLDWNEAIDSLASALRVSDKINTVSPGYLEELPHEAQGLEWIFAHQSHKMLGLLNGVDYEVWNPKTDSYLKHHQKKSIQVFKKNNKKELVESFENKDLPLFVFIGRFAAQKGVDIMIQAIDAYLSHLRGANFYILGSGDKSLEQQVAMLQGKYPKSLKAVLDYNEPLSHELYAGGDFLLMPSRVEPCGLNQMFSMRYGTVPVVNHTGGLKDTVPDISVGGNGISFDGVTTAQLLNALSRALELYEDKSQMKDLIDKISALDLSWDASARAYAEEYRKLIHES